MATAYLGADFALDAASGRYKLASVFPGDNTRDKYRSPLTAPGVDVHAGEFLLAVDGQELKAPTDPYSVLVGKQDSTLKLTIADGPNGRRRDVTVEPVGNELAFARAGVDRSQPRVGGQSLRRQSGLYLSVGYGWPGHGPVHPPVLCATRQAGADFRRPLERRRLHRPDCARAAAAHPDRAGYQPGGRQHSHAPTS